jgi:SAM-dependent methyltransferase
MNIEKIMRNYAKLYCLEHVTAEQVMHHWNWERQMRRELLAAPAESRWEVFEDRYSRHYSELFWLRDAPQPCHSQEWLDLIGKPSKKVFEIGSGKGGLIKALADAGHECTGTEITRERGKRWVEDTNVRWHTTDGVHLDRFEPRDYYDFVISNQVIEHMHPDDLQAHFEGVYAILRPGGRYIVATPHRFLGPCDVSCLFGSSECEGQHLKEYTYKEISALAKTAGFREVAASLRFPHPVRRISDRCKARASRVYQGYLESIETILDAVPTPVRRPVSQLARSMYFRTTIYMAVLK